MICIKLVDSPQKLDKICENEPHVGVRDLSSLHPETLSDESPNFYRSQQHQGGQKTRFHVGVRES